MEISGYRQGRAKPQRWRAKQAVVLVERGVASTPKTLGKQESNRQSTWKVGVKGLATVAGPVATREPGTMLDPAATNGDEITYHRRFLCRQRGAVISDLDRLGAREQTAVDRVHNRSSSDHPPIKIAAVEPLDGVLSALDLVELEVDVALRVGVE